jgi:chaperonin GroEL
LSLVLQTFADGQLVLPDTAKEKPQQETVIAVDPGRRDENGKAIAVDLSGATLEAPLKKIAANAGEDGGVILAGVRQEQIKQKNNKIGSNVMTNTYVDMIKEGIIDPAKVTRGALENAASIAAMILTTEALITDMPEEHAGGGMPEGMPMY